MGGSYTYIYPAVAIILSPRYTLFIGDPLAVRTCSVLQRARLLMVLLVQLIKFISSAEVRVHDEVAAGRAHHRWRVPGRRRLLRHMEGLHKVSLQSSLWLPSLLLLSR